MVTLLLAACAARLDTQPKDTGGPRDSEPNADPADSEDSGDPATSTDSTDPEDIDEDHDGYSPVDGDCDDTRWVVHPGQPDGCDALDQDCDGEPIPEGSCGVASETVAPWWLLGGDLDPAWRYASTAGDLDGDSIEDAFVGDLEDGYYLVAVVLGSTWTQQIEIDRADARWSRPTDGVLGDQIAAGDFDGDGLGDFWQWTYTGGLDQEHYNLVQGRTSGWADGAPVDQDAAAWWDSAGDNPNPYSLPVGDADFTGDGRADLVVFWERRITLLTAEDGLPQGALLRNVRRGGTLELDVESGSPGDLDGDGIDELVGASPTYDALLTLQGEDLATSDGANLAALSSAASFGTTQGGPTYVFFPSVDLDTHYRGDVDGDGLDDMAVGLAIPDATGTGEQYGLAILAGGIPEGRANDWEQGRLLAAHIPDQGSRDYVEPRQWIPDVDDDGAPDLLVDLHAFLNDPEDQDCILRTSAIIGGGVYLTTDPGVLPGPCNTYVHFHSDRDAMVDLDGDGLAEWCSFAGIEKGFAIPWDDPSKW